MTYIVYFVVGILTVLTWSVLWYLIKPKTYVITVSNLQISRLQIFFHHILALFIGLILLVIFIPENNVPASDTDLTVFLIGFIFSIIFLIYFGRNKINIGGKSDNQPVQPVQPSPFVAVENKIDKSELRQAKHSNIKLNNTILGFFEGIFIDDTINEVEIKGLMRWIEVYPEFCELANFDSLYQILNKAINDKAFLEKNRSEVNELLITFKRSKYFASGTADIQRLHGLLSGLLCDGNITDIEVLALQQWLDEHKHLKEENLYEEIYSLLSTVRVLNKVDLAVIEALVANISKYVNRDDYCLPKVALSSTLEQKNPNFYHGEFKIDGALFCLTGASNRYTKAEWKEAIESKGGLFTDSLTKKVKYLVICNKGNPNWVHMSYGRKFEQAVTWKKDGHDLNILTEDDFVSVLEK